MTPRADYLCRRPTLKKPTMPKMTDRLTEFLRLESAGGLLFAAAAILALICSNSPLRQAYDDLLKVPVEMRFGSFAIAKPLPLWDHRRLDGHLLPPGRLGGQA